MYSYKSDLEQKQFEIVWKRSVFEIPNNISYEYSYGYRYCRCLGHDAGISKVFEIWYDTKEHEWGYPEFENGKFYFRISNNENSPYYWCYMRDVEVFILNNSRFPQLLK